MKNVFDFDIITYYEVRKGILSMPKFFVNANDISDGSIILTGENARHLSTVLRSKEGDKLIVCDGEGNDYYCMVSSLNKENVTVTIESQEKCQTEPKVNISLFQGVPKGDKLSLIVEKCVEAGIMDITPVDMERSVSKLSKKDFQKKKERYDKIAMSAAKQSGRGKVPLINGLLSFDEMISELDKFDLVVFPYENEEERTLKSLIKGFSGESIAIIIGPEGGFSQKEAGLLKDKNILPVSLRKRILRTETAGLATVFNILYELEL